MDLDMVIARTVKLDQFCKSILDADRNVRSVAILDGKGKLLHSAAHRGAVQPSLEKWNDTRYMECTFDISMGAKFDDLYGPVRYHHSDKDDFIMFSFPHHKNIIIITSTKKISPITFATKIAHMINDFKEF
ncbi:MAG: hypothetical protein ACYC6W_02330 [Nitrosotalea sp.]